MKEIKDRKTNTLQDQYTAFGEQVGMRIRDLPSVHAQKVVKHLISYTLFEEEMEHMTILFHFPTLIQNLHNIFTHHFKLDSKHFLQHQYLHLFIIPLHNLCILVKFQQLINQSKQL